MLFRVSESFDGQASHPNPYGPELLHAVPSISLNAMPPPVEGCRTMFLISKTVCWEYLCEQGGSLLWELDILHRTKRLATGDSSLSAAAATTLVSLIEQLFGEKARALESESRSTRKYQTIIATRVNAQTQAISPKTAADLMSQGRLPIDAGVWGAEPHRRGFSD